MRKTLTALGLTAGLAAGSVAGLTLAGTTGMAGAQSDTTTSIAAAPASSTNANANTNGATTQDRPDPSVRLQEILKPLVTDNTLTQAQADKVVDTLKAAGPPDGGGRGHGGPGAGQNGQNGQDGQDGRRGGPGIEAAASALGVTAEDLRTELTAGKSIATVAADKGVDVKTVIAAMVKAHAEHLAADVTSGKLTQAEADQRSVDAESRITAMVNGERPSPPAAAAK